MARVKAEEDKRNSFMFYASFEDTINEIDESDINTKYLLYRAICRYALFREEPKMQGVAKIVWKIIKPLLEKQWTNYLNSLKGGANEGNQNASKQPKNNRKTTEKQGKEEVEVEAENDVKEKEHPNRGVNNTPPNLEDLDDWCYALTTAKYSKLPKNTQEKILPLWIRWCNAKEMKMFTAMKDVEQEMSNKMKNEIIAMRVMWNVREQEKWEAERQDLPM